MALFSTYAGRLSDRKDPRIVIGAGLVSSSLGLLLLTRLGSGIPLLLVIIALALAGAGIALCQSPLVRTNVSSVSKEMYGLASGMIETMRLMGMTISIAISIIIFSIIIGTTQITPSAGPAFIESLHLIFWILLVFSLAALLVASVLKRPAPQEDHPLS